MIIRTNLECEQEVLPKYDERLSKFFDQVYTHQLFRWQLSDEQKVNVMPMPRSLYIYCGFGEADNERLFYYIDKPKDPIYIRLDIESKLSDTNSQLDRIERVPEGDVNFLVNGERYASYFKESQMMFMRDLTHHNNKFAHEILDKVLTELEALE